MKIIFATLLFRLTTGITTFMVPGALPAVVKPWKRKVLPGGCLFGQAGEGFDKWGVAENDGIAAYRQQVFFLRLRCFEIFIFCAEWIVFLVCEVVKGYFSFVFPVPRPNRRIHGVADNNSTKGMECVNDMLLVFFCTGHGNFPLSSTKGCGLIYDSKGRQHFMICSLYERQ